MHIHEFQEMMKRLYLHRDSERGVKGTYEWLVDEVAEVGEALEEYYGRPPVMVVGDGDLGQRLNPFAAGDVFLRDRGLDDVKDGKFPFQIGQDAFGVLGAEERSVEVDADLEALRDDLGSGRKLVVKVPPRPGLCLEVVVPVCDGPPAPFFPGHGSRIR